MKVDRVVTDKSLRRVLEALDHNLTARDNFGPEGQEGWVLTSRGPDHIPEYRPVSIVGNPDVNIDWDQITNTPNSLAGYGIENAYTITQVNALIDTHTHPASDIVSGILDPSRLGDGAADEHTFLRGDSTWQPLSLSGLGIAGEVAGHLAVNALKEVEGPDDWPTMIPGPRGIDGTIGRDGAAGPPGQDGEPVDDWPLLTPGPQGPQGVAGAPGAPGAGAATYFQLVTEEGPEPWSYASGPASATREVGNTLIQFMTPWEDQSEQWAYPNGPSAAAASGGGVAGAGTIDTIPKWTGASALGDSLLYEDSGTMFLGLDTGSHVGFWINSAIDQQRDVVWATAGVPRWALRVPVTAEAGADSGADLQLVKYSDAGVPSMTMEITRSTLAAIYYGPSFRCAQFTVDGAAWMYAAGSDVIGFHSGGGNRFAMNNSTFYPLVDNAYDLGANSNRFRDAYLSSRLLIASAGNPTVRWDFTGAAADEKKWRALANGTSFLFQLLNDAESVAASVFTVTRIAMAIGSFRLHTHLDWITNNTYDVGSGGNYPRTVFAATSFSLSADTVLSQSGTVLLVGNDATWTQLNLYTGGTARWHIVTAGHYLPVADNTYDIGSTALQVRDIHIEGELVAENGVNGKTADQATFANALTDISGTSWVVGANERWEFEIFIPYTTNATAGTVGWTVNGPAGTTVSYQVFGTTTAVTAYSTTFSAVLNVGVGALGTLVSSTNHFVVIRGRLTTVGTAGTAIARGITSAAGKTVIAKNGTYVKARRVV